jgi:cytoskeletal protein RodZ
MQIFQEIGQQMRDRRESLGLTLVDVEHYTRLRQHYLSAIEDGRLNDLPSLVQGRGMLFNYATFLEMDAEGLLLQFAEGLQERRIEIMPPEPAPNLLKRQKTKPSAPAPASALRRFITPDLLIGGGVILTILVFAIWGASQVSALRSQEAARTEAPIANVLLFTQTPTPPAVANEGIAPPAITVAPNSEIGNLPPPEDAGESTPTSLPVLDEAPLQVYVIAQDRAWLRVIEDGEVAFSGRVVPGNPYPFSGEEQIELTSGNAAGIRIFFNQQELGNLGLHGQVINLIFNLEGVVTPTPSFTETPTATQVPSITPAPSETPRATPSITPFIP